MTLTTKIVRQYQCCGQVMPVPMVIKKLECWRPPMPLQPPPLLQPACPYAPLQQPYQPPPQHYRPYPQPYPYSYPVNAMQQQQPQHQQQQYAITVQNQLNVPQNFQTQLTSSENDSDSHYHRPPDYQIVEYSSEKIVPTGNIVIQTTNTIPDGYLLCDGSDVSREIESTLFSVIGTFYGDGDGSNTFCLPDLEDEEHPTHYYMIKR